MNNSHIIINTEELQCYLRDIKKIPVISHERQDEIFKLISSNISEDEKNKLCLAGLAEGYFQSHFKNRIVSEFANNPDSKYKSKSSKEGKVIVVGNGQFIFA